MNGIRIYTHTPHTPRVCQKASREVSACVNLETKKDTITIDTNTFNGMAVNEQKRWLKRQLRRHGRRAKWAATAKGRGANV